MKPYAPFVAIVCAIALLYPPNIHGQTRQQDVVMLCHGLGKTVGQVQQGRRSGIEDSANQAINMLNELSSVVEEDLMSSVDPFLDKTRRLPEYWTAALYTHACIYNYTQQLSQIALISSMVIARCDMSRADPGCLEQVFYDLPEQQAI